MKFELEICANSINSAIAAQNGGAHRIEFCNNLAEGGTTPSYGQIKWCIQNLSLEVWSIIRPRGGDFLYNDQEFETILNDIKQCKELGCNGLVTGILTANGNIDLERCKLIIEAADGLPVEFHRAFDRCADQSVALEDIISLGFVRILSSGAAADAFTGATKLAELIKQAAGRIEIMPGAGINPANIVQIAQITGAKSFHSSAKRQAVSKMNKHQPTDRIFESEDNIWLETDDKIVSQLYTLLDDFYP